MHTFLLSKFVVNFGLQETVQNQLRHPAKSISVTGLIQLISLLACVPWFKAQGVTEATMTSNHIRDYILQV